jgi:hypothetical protein
MILSEDEAYDEGDGGSVPEDILPPSPALEFLPLGRSQDLPPLVPMEEAEEPATPGAELLKQLEASDPMDEEEAVPTAMYKMLRIEDFVTAKPREEAGEARPEAEMEEKRKKPAQEARRKTPPGVRDAKLKDALMRYCTPAAQKRQGKRPNRFQ